MKTILRKLISPLEKYLLAELVWMAIKYTKNRRTKSSLKTLRWMLRKCLELFINRMKIVRKDNSFANEATTLEDVLNQFHPKGKFLVDIGAADGIRQSSTAHFLNNLGWGGALFEYDSDSFSRLAYLYNDREDITLCKSKVTPQNIAGLLNSLGVPKNFDYLNIDVDSYDLSILREMLEADFKPSMISMEVNENFPPEIYFEVVYNENHFWRGDHFFGCSLSAANETLTKYGYLLVCMEYNNAIFIDSQFSSKVQTQKNLKTAYAEGDLNKPDRKQLFPWNEDTEFLLTDIQVNEKITKVNNLFSQYEGKYIIKEVS